MLEVSISLFAVFSIILIACYFYVFYKEPTAFDKQEIANPTDYERSQNWECPYHGTFYTNQCGCRRSIEARERDEWDFEDSII